LLLAVSGEQDKVLSKQEVWTSSEDWEAVTTAETKWRWNNTSSGYSVN